MLPVLKAFGEGAGSVKEVIPIVRTEFDISDDEAAELIPSGQTTVLANRVHWARTYMSKAGLLWSPKRGVHNITDEGRDVLSRGYTRIDNTILTQISPRFEEWRLSARKSSAGKEKEATPADSKSDVLNSNATTPDEAIGRAISEMAAELKDELLSLIRDMDPIAFERLVLRLLEAMGYGAGDLASKLTTKASGDGGIDGIIHEDALGLDAVYIQAKRYAADNKVSRPAIQQFVGSLTGESAKKVCL